MARNKRKIWFIAYADLHLTRYTNYNEGNRRMLNALNVIKRTKMVAKVHKCPILFLGDLFDKEKHITNPVLEDTLPYLSKSFYSDKTMTYAISGNHDQSSANLIGNESPSYIKTLSKSFKGIECMDFKYKDFGDWDLYGVPYITHDLGITDYINSLTPDWEKINVLMLHTTMPNVYDTDGRSMLSHIPTNEFEKAVSRFDIVLSGHIHKPMEFEIGKTKIIQVGAPQQQRFTDRNCEMGYWICYDMDFKMEFVPLTGYPKFVELEPGEQKPDNKNFYVTRPAKKDKTISNVPVKKFSVDLSGNKLARNYCKEKGIKDKVKRKALKETLKNAL